MKTNKETLQTMMDRRLSFLDDLPSCRAAVQARIAQEEEPVMKKKISLGFVFALVLVLLLWRKQPADTAGALGLALCVALAWGWCGTAP